MSEIKLSENQARAIYMLDSHNVRTGNVVMSDLNDWGFSALELANIKRQIPVLAKKGLAVTTDNIFSFRLTEEAYSTLSRWLHLEGGEEIVNTWY